MNQIPAVIYARKSADEQLGRRSDIGAQVEEIQRFANRSGYQIIDKFVDDAKKGWDDARPAMKRMLREARSKNCRFRMIIVAEWDRFYRSYAKAQQIIEELESRGITLASARGGPAENQNERLGRNFALMVAEIDNVFRSGHVLSGQIHWASQGYSVGGRPPYGYKRGIVMDHRGNVRIKYEIDEATAPVVRKIYEMYADGKCAAEIAEILNAEGVAPPKSFRWKEHVWRILFSRSNQMKYTGQVVFNRTRNFKKQRRSVPKKEEDWIIAQGAHEPIVTQGLVDAVNAMHARPERQRGGSKSRRILKQ